MSKQTESLFKKFEELDSFCRKLHLRERNRRALDKKLAEMRHALLVAHPYKSIKSIIFKWLKK